MKIFLIILSAVSFVFIVSCSSSSSDNSAELEEAEQLLFTEYVKESGINNISEAQAYYDSLSVYIIEREEGEGKAAIAGDWVSVRYSVFLLDSTLLYYNIYDRRPYSFTLTTDFSNNQTIPANVLGFHSGIGTMKVGGKATFVMASDQALGSSYYEEQYTLSSGEAWYKFIISAYTPLRFEVELTDVQRDERD